MKILSKLYVKNTVKEYYNISSHLIPSFLHFLVFLDFLDFPPQIQNFTLLT